MNRLAAFYACNVFHYHHVVEAMRSAGLDVTLATRFEVSPRRMVQVRRAPLPAGVTSLLERRVVERPDDVSFVGLGPAAMVLPLAARVDAIPFAAAHRRAADGQARWITRRARRSDLFQFSEGLGHRVLERGFAGFAICERRHLHHEALEGNPGVVGDFPHRDQLDPIGDFLDTEYELADRIAVYSEVARSSFVERGFSPDKVVVTPLGMPLLDHGGPVPERDARTVAFVGRGDAFKGLDVAVAAVAAMGEPFRLEVAGACSAEVRQWLAGQRHVRFRGILGRTELRDLYRRAKVLLAPSIESFGYAALEGAAYGAHLVCAPTTGAHEFLPAHTYRLVPGRAPEAWATACLDAARNDDDSAVDVRAALSRMTWSESAARLAPLYDAVVADLEGV